MSAEVLKKEFIPKYLATGDEKFYRFLLTYALKKLVLINNGTYKGISPDLELLDYYDRFVTLYRIEGDEVYLQLSRLFRKSAHRIYRIMLKKNMTITNNKFLNLV